MKNKGFLLSLFIAGSLTANAQDIKEWLSLTPIKMEKMSKTRYLQMPCSPITPE